MTRPTWKIEIDLDGDGDFSEVNEDVSSYVQGINWQIGFTDAFEPMARAATLGMTLRNADKRFSPENSDSPIAPNFTRGKVVRITSTYESVTRVHSLTWIEAIDPTPGTKRARVTQVNGEGLLSRAQKPEANAPVMENTRSDVAIDTVLLAGGVLPPGFTGRWLLGQPGHSEVGVNTQLGAASDYLAADAGVTTFAVIGDSWAGTSIYSALQDIVGREAGKLFTNRNGVVEFWGRDHLFTDTDVDATFQESDFFDIDYTYGDDLANRVTVPVRTRTIGTSNETLGQIDKAIEIEPSESREVSFRYVDAATGANVSGKNAVAPVANIDFTATANEDGTGANYTSNITAVIVAESATRSKVRFSNSGGASAWVQPGATIRGIKITDYGEADVEKEDLASIRDYGLSTYTYPFVMDDVAIAESLAQHILDYRRLPRGRIRSVTILPYKSTALTAQALTRTIGDRIAIGETQTDVFGDYFIVGEKHRLTGKNYQLTWFLEPASVSTYWQLEKTGFSELGETTYIA
ncbi:MAG: hypothetical protein AAF485_02035 [Chloroflexota bacterium]